MVPASDLSARERRRVYNVMGVEKKIGDEKMADETEAAKGTGMDTGDDTGKNSADNSASNAADNAANDAGKVVDCSVIIPWMTAAADPKEQWWKWMRGNPKRS